MVKARPSWSAVLLVLWCCLQGAGVGADSDYPQRRLLLAQRSWEYGAGHLSAQRALVVDPQGQLDAAGYTASYLAAAVLLNHADERVAGTVEALLSLQDMTPRSPGFGLFPRYVDSPPSLEATCLLVPLLAWVQERNAFLGEALQGKLRQSLDAAGSALEKARLEAPHPYLGLMRAAALARSQGARGDQQKAANTAQKAVGEWLDDMLKQGDGLRPGATAAALRLAALAWLAASMEAGHPDARAAARLAALDLQQRRQAGNGALGGAAAWVVPADYVAGGTLSRSLLYLWGLEPAPAGEEPLAGYLDAPEPVALDALGAWGQAPLPLDLTTLARGEGVVRRTDTHMAQLYSLGTMNGPAAGGTLPVLVTFGKAERRPTAYFYPEPAPARVTSLQQGNQAIVGLDFDQVGLGERTNVCLRGVLGPRRGIRQVLLNGGPWPGDAAAVGESAVVAIERDGVYLGVRVLQTGAALRPRQVELPKPGVLRWQGPGEDAELELLLWARKRNYQVSPPEDNDLAGVALWIVPATEYPSLREFSVAMLRAKLRQTVSAKLERLPEEGSPYERFLRENDPKSKAEYRYAQHLYHEVTWENGAVSLSLQEDLSTGQTLSAKTSSTAPAAEGSWQSPLLQLPWNPLQARLFLTGAGG